jgi:hypothetical protein
MSFFPVKPEYISFRSQGIIFFSRTLGTNQNYSKKELGLLLEYDRPTLNYDIQQIINVEIFLNLKLFTQLIKFIDLCATLQLLQQEFSVLSLGIIQQRKNKEIIKKTYKCIQ